MNAFSYKDTVSGEASVEAPVFNLKRQQNLSISIGD